MHNRVLMAKFDPEWAIDENPGCECGHPFYERETVALYPIPEIGWNAREAVCITCHFWFTHNVMEEIDR